MMVGASDLSIHTSNIVAEESADCSNPTLYVRSPKDADDREVVYTFPDDDPYDLFNAVLRVDTLESFRLSSRLLSHLTKTLL